MNVDGKYKGRKFLIVVWAAALVTVLSILALILNRDSAWLLGALTVLCSIPAFYVGIRAYKQKVGE
jgi:hypothetical protein